MATSAAALQLQSNVQETKSLLQVDNFYNATIPAMTNSRKTNFEIFRGDIMLTYNSQY